MLARYSSPFKGIPTRSERPSESAEELRLLFSEPMVQSFVEILENHKQTEMLFGTLRTTPGLKPLVVDSLKIVLNKPEAKDLFTGPDAMERLEFVFGEMNTNEENTATLRVLLSEVQKQTDLVGELTKKTFDPKNANFYLSLLQSNRDRNELLEWCIQGLRLLDSTVWSQNLFVARADVWRPDDFTQGPALALAFYLKSLGIEVELGEAYVNSLIGWALTRSDMSAWPLPPAANENVVALVGPLGSAARVAFFERLEAIMKDGKGVLRPWFFPLFGQELVAQLNYSARGIDALEVIVARKTPGGLEWLKETLAKSGNSLESIYFSCPEWLSFKGALRRALMFGQADTDTFPHIRSIADILDVKPLKNGQIAFAVFNEAKLYALDPTNPKPIVLLEDSAARPLMQPSWSPDGSELAYTSASDIFVFDLKTHSTRMVTNGSGNSSAPSWSPDGKFLAFVREDGVESNIFKIDLQTLQEQKLTSAEGVDGHPNWSPDGRRIAFHRVETGASTIRTIEVDGLKELRLTDGPFDIEPSWSPDGKELTFARHGSESGVMITKHEFPTMLVLQPVPNGPVWSPDGKQLIFQSRSGAEAVIYQVDADGKNQKQLAKGIDPTWQPVTDDESEPPTTDVDSPSSESTTTTALS